MVNEQSEQLDAVFHALADPTRRAMLRNLAREPHSVSDLAAPFAMSLVAASKHIRVLERAGLVRRQITGRTHICHLDARPMHGGLEWMRHYEQYWHRSLDDLETLLRAEDAAAQKPAGSDRK
ncbi:ArsR/SmtB family transcription factor [Microbulbifer taiwanensis]|uniref:ArsR/SmtB family transcription factor n=1 Tax=Microbulbifer taiwanensis TaxID=986746 RepID=A0ABW1YK48_9GAMM|nr:metalloregulator ArsR/SmtB family transcription factor [Microbulbifer taiwanensis]